jgi:aminomethyltransferase
MQRSSLFAIQQKLGATFSEVADWELPQHYGDPQSEYQAVRQGVGLSDLSHLGWARMTGAMVSNDTASLEPGQGCHTTFLTNRGKMIADFVVYAETDAYLFEMQPQIVHPLIDALQWFVISEDVTLQDERGAWGCLALQGPRAVELLAQTLAQDVPELPMYAHVRYQIGGHDVRLLRRSHTDESGYQLLTALEALPAVWQAIWAHREACAAQPVGLAALEVLRIEAGIPIYGIDMSDDTMPVEANLVDAISYNKGCYIGQEVIARIDARGHVNRKLVGLLLDGETLPASGAKIVSPQREVGWVTSSTYSPAQRHNIALGYVRREVWKAGTELQVQSNGAPMRAIVSDLPFCKA